METGTLSLFMCPWASNIAFLSLSLLIYKIRLVHTDMVSI